jgi:hypothetical protein
MPQLIKFKFARGQMVEIISCAVIGRVMQQCTYTDGSRGYHVEYRDDNRAIRHEWRNEKDLARVGKPKRKARGK